MFSSINIVDTLQLVIIIFISIGFHEYAHAIVSYKLGDPTPKQQGRLTLNPLAHVDPVGGILILFVILSGRGIGRGKPVQINPYNYKNPVKGELMVALAGPAMNILLAIASCLLFFIYAKVSGFGLSDLFYQPDWFTYFFMMFTSVNIGLAVFNLIPIRPLDGFDILKVAAPKVASRMLQYKQYISIALLILILAPGSNFLVSGLGHIRNFIFEIIFGFFSSIFY